MIPATTITGTRRGIDTLTYDNKIELVIYNSRGNVEGWNICLAPENARELANELKKLASITESRKLSSLSEPDHD